MIEQYISDFFSKEHPVLFIAIAIILFIISFSILYLYFLKEKLDGFGIRLKRFFFQKKFGRVTKTNANVISKKVNIININNYNTNDIISITESVFNNSSVLKISKYACFAMPVVPEMYLLMNNHGADLCKMNENDKFILIKYSNDIMSDYII